MKTALQHNAEQTGHAECGTRTAEWGVDVMLARSIRALMDMAEERDWERAEAIAENITQQIRLQRLADAADAAGIVNAAHHQRRSRRDSASRATCDCAPDGCCEICGGIH